MLKKAEKTTCALRVREAGDGAAVNGGAEPCLSGTVLRSGLENHKDKWCAEQNNRFRFSDGVRKEWVPLPHSEPDVRVIINEEDMTPSQRTHIGKG